MKESQFTTIYRIAKGSTVEELESEVNRIINIKPHCWTLSTGMVIPVEDSAGKRLYIREMIGFFPEKYIVNETNEWEDYENKVLYPEFA
jgi:hypothetical protein